MDLSQSTVIISGGASGLGEATARLLVRQGARVVILDLNDEAGSKLASELGENVLFFKVNVAEEAEVQSAIDKAVAYFGSIQIVINCAGVSNGEKIVGKKNGIYGPHALESFERTIRVNLIGTFNVIRLGAFAMEKNMPNQEGERGVIINTASVAAYDGQIGQTAYAASKGGIASLTLPAARDLAPLGIRVMAIAPGLFDTPMMQGFSEEVRTSLGAQVPFPPRLGKPSEYALLVKSIVENPMLNGEVIRLDGAVRMAPR